MVQCSRGKLLWLEWKCYCVSRLKEFWQYAVGVKHLQDQITHLGKQISQVDKELYHLRGHLLEVTVCLGQYTRAHTLPERQKLIEALQKISGHIAEEQTKDVPGEVTYE